MKRSKKHLICTVVSAWIVSLTLPCALAQYPRPEQPQSQLPTRSGYVTDYAKVLSPQWSGEIRSICKELERQTGVEMIVVIFPTIEPHSSVRKYASTLYEGWRIGTAQQQRGILLLASVKEQKAVVVLGRTLLSVVTREQLDELTNEFFIPMFQKKAFGMHLYQATVRLAAASGKVQLGDQPKKKSGNAGFWMNLGVVIVMVFVLWRFTRPERPHPFQRWRRGEYWSTGQGGFGGNFGGFGGRMEE